MVYVLKICDEKLSNVFPNNVKKDNCGDTL